VDYLLYNAVVKLLNNDVKILLIVVFLYLLIDFYVPLLSSVNIGWFGL